MYENYFGLHHRPFSAVPRVDDYFPAESIESARSTLIRVAQRSEGIGLLIGAPGTGKTLLCQRIEHDVEELFRVVILGHGHGIASRRELYQSLLFELGLKYAGLDEGELRLALLRHQTRTGSTLPLLLIVDDAQRLEVELLEELRRLTEISRGGEAAVHLILAGSAGLEEKFAHPALESFNQRIAARCYLESFNQEETRGYLAARIGAAGAVLDSLITAEAVECIARATDGVPRLINQLADQALMLAASQNVRPIWGKLVEQAWAELQQLPAPWNETHLHSAGCEPAGVVEFGSLDSGDEQSDDISELDNTHEEPAVETTDSESTQQATATLQELVLPNDLEDMFRELAEGDTPGEQESIHADEDAVASFETSEVAEIVPVQTSTFEEEEVVLDRYAALDARGGRPLPKVYSVEGRELSALLQSRLAEETPPPADSPEFVPQAEVQELAEASLADELEFEPPIDFAADLQPAPIEETILPPSDLPVEDVASVTEQVPAVDEVEYFELDNLVEEPEVADVIPAHAEATETADFEEDEDLIVIDDEGEHEGGTVPLVAVAPVRREEYRTLFSRLRRGRLQS